MHLDIIWSEFAENKLDEIFEYYSHHASERAAKKLVISLINEPKKLIKNPYIGQVEKLLLKRNEPYRYLIHQNYKIIYSVDELNNLNKIADVFDTRQNPEKIERIE